MGRIRTKENIAVDTHLIGKVPSSLGGCLWSYLNHSVTPLRTDVDRIRISVVKQFSESLGGFLFKHGSFRTQENIAVGTLLIGIATPIGGYMIVSESWLKPLSGRVSGRIRTGSP